MKTKLELIPIIVPAVVITAACLFGPTCCTRPDKAKMILQQQGYTDITITGWRPFMAGQDDATSTGFEATSPNGSRVTGAVTGGLALKGATIRFD